ncbi:MAG: TetR family transcriptional regulator [Kiritimatiellae bacterium]|nr:TetR family transcriptional regulator [Kiritimatiellia bacterium]
MARRAKQDAEKTRTRILASALALFARKGYEHTTFTDVAARLKMTKGAVYWHFETKQALLLALLDEMLAKFRRQTERLLPPGETSFEGLAFPVVADMMVRNAVQIVSDAKGTAFFLLVHEQVQWADVSMADVRSELMRNKRFGPWAAFKTAVENEMRAGRVREDVDPVQVASVCVAIFDGIVHARIARLLQCDMEDTLRKSYAAVWRSIAVAPGASPAGQSPGGASD